MLEISTGELSAEALRAFLEKVRAERFFSLRAKTVNSLSFVRNTLPLLKGYVIKKSRVLPDIFIDYAGLFSLSTFWNLAQQLEGKAEKVSAHLQINEADQPFDVLQHQDLKLSFGFNSLAPRLTLSVGDVSPGFTDLAYRQRLFNEFLEVLGLGHALKVVFVENELDLKFLTDTFCWAKSIPYTQWRDAYNKGMRFVDTSASYRNRRNFSNLSVVYDFSLDELETHVAHLIALYGGDDHILDWDFRVACWQADYEPVRTVLNASPLQPWQLSFSAVSKYTLHTLDQATAENDEFSFQAFSIDPPGVGEVYVDLHYSHGAFTLFFHFDYEEDEQEAELHRLITAWAGGLDIIDHTPI